MTIAVRPATQRRFASPPAARRSRTTMSSRPPQTLSRRRAHTRRSHPRLRKSPSCSVPTITPAAFRPRRHIADRSATSNPHRLRPAKPRLSFPRFPPYEAFGRRPASSPARLQRAGVRNPSALTLQHSCRSLRPSSLRRLRTAEIRTRSERESEMLRVVLNAWVTPQNSVSRTTRWERPKLGLSAFRGRQGGFAARGKERCPLYVDFRPSA